MSICKNCKQNYDKKWYITTDNRTTTHCFFCTNFLPMRDTYSSILLGIELNFMMSGEISRREYYNNFLDNLYKWSSWFNVFPTEEDKIYEKDLRKAEDWSRDNWSLFISLKMKPT
jgi:hypothetical protein